MTEFAITVEYYKESPDGTRDTDQSEVPVGHKQSIQFDLCADAQGTLVTTVWDKEGTEVSKTSKVIGPRSFIITCFEGRDVQAVNRGGYAKWYETERGIQFDEGDPGRVNPEPGTGTVFETADGSQYVMAPTGQTYQLAGPRR